MTDIQYGVVHQDGRWRVIGPHLRFGAFASWARAVRAARQLAHASSGLPVTLHLQDAASRLRSPIRIEPAEPRPRRRSR